MQTLSIDIETYSDGIEPIKCGVYKYAESPGFLGIHYCSATTPTAPVTVIDLAQGETSAAGSIDALTDEHHRNRRLPLQSPDDCLSRYLRDLGVSALIPSLITTLSTRCTRFLNPESTALLYGLGGNNGTAAFSKGSVGSVPRS